MRVALERLGATTLGEAAIEQDASAFAFDEVHRAGDRARGAVK